MPITLKTARMRYKNPTTGQYVGVNSVGDADLAEQIQAVEDSIAPDYTDLVFPVAAGQKCYYENVLYSAKQAILTAETWTAAHWEEVVVGEELNSLKNALTQKLSKPDVAGTSGQVLTSDGQGGQTWETPNPVVNVSGTTPSINGVAGTRYICGECATLDITAPTNGIVDIVFESGSTPTVLTVTPPTGMTMKWANGFDPTALEANTTYEINIMNGCMGVAGTWD